MKLETSYSDLQVSVTYEYDSTLCKHNIRPLSHMTSIGDTFLESVHPFVQRFNNAQRRR